jgi:MtN3 and saliva related transmembrane protein
MMPWILIGSIAAVLTMFGFVPQIVKMYRTKSVTDVSAITLFQFTIGVSLWAVYGFAIRDVVVIGANIISLITLVVALLLYFHYRTMRKRERKAFPETICQEARNPGVR